MHRIFTEGGFARVLRAGDSRRFGIDLKKDRTKHITDALKASDSAPASFASVFKTSIKKRHCISIKDYSHSLILRAIALYLIRRYSIHFRNRDSIIREVIETLGDSTPMYIIRRDITSFYESVPTQELKKDLDFNIYIPSRVRHFLKLYFATLCTHDKGVPRGLGISSVVAELAMRKIDTKIRGIDGIYKYFRYSDDILIFCYKNPYKIASTLNTIFKPTGLAFNKSKSEIISVNNIEKDKKSQINFEYLGYKFAFNDLVGDKKPRLIMVRIADKKIKRLQTRLICSMKSYAKNKDFALLIDRIKFLSSNYYAYRTGMVAIKTSPYVRSGISYNYHLCGIYHGSARKPHDCRELKALDAFYRSLLRSKTSSFSILFKPYQLMALEKLSFFGGFEKKMTIRFKADRVQQIKEAWRNG